MRRVSGWLAVIPLMLPALLVTAAARARQVVINEVMSLNTLTVQDEYGDSSDWVELYNTSSASVNLKDWYLSDSASSPYKWKFPNALVIPAGGFVRVWASGRNLVAFTVHTSWSIKASGEPIVLSDPTGRKVDEFPAMPLGRDISLGRSPDGTGPLRLFRDATPRLPNTTTAYLTDPQPAPVFSVPAGFHASEVTVSISSSAPDGVIRYTLDGSDPSEASTPYSGPIKLDSSSGARDNLSAIRTNAITPGPPYYEGWEAPQGPVFEFPVLRASLFRDGYLPSRVTTASYVIDPAGPARFPFAVASISTHPDNLFDDRIGIYVKGDSYNYAEEGVEWERSGHLEFFEPGGVRAFHGEVGLRIHGGTTVNRPRKSLRVYARSPVSSDPFQYRIFPEKSVDRFETFILRNGGNDWGGSLFRDGLVSELASDTDVDRQCTRPVVVFLDGEYWGLHDIRDRFDEGYYLYHYGLGELEFTQLEYEDQTWVADRGEPSLLSDFTDILADAESGAYASAAGLAELESRVDLDNFIDYCIQQIWCGNTDWPQNNHRVWRSVAAVTAPAAHPKRDGRWRWLLFDADFAFALDLCYVIGGGEGALHDTLGHAITSGTTYTFCGDGRLTVSAGSTVLLRRALENPLFRERFLSRFADRLNSRLSATHAESVLDGFVAAYTPGMAEHAARWCQPVDWSQEVRRIRDYMRARPDALRSHLDARFGLGGLVPLTVDLPHPERGAVRVNTILIGGADPALGTTCCPWTGTYFRNLPVKLRAEPSPGHRFVGWIDSEDRLGDARAAEIEIDLAGPRTLTARFVSQSCSADLDGSGEVDGADIGQLLTAFGTCPGCAEDLDGSGEVDAADIGSLLVLFGACP
jgi:hypothetical protein